ncbi:FtsX-like permease family protein [Streptomyces sp. NPDC020412]|uniref:FtsX-like permease family protein n=1 Tax=Streptomyces sp. NPDC020412 TaxID=3365073 RepID=UPI0037AD7EF0
MKTWLHSWRAALRIARRDAWRAKGRSFLVLAMIALPIMGVSAADLTLRSAELSTTEKMARQLGTADAVLSDPGMGGVPILQEPAGDMYDTAENYENKPWPDGKGDVTKGLPAGAKTLTDTVGRAKVNTEHGLMNTEVRELKTADPMAKGIAALEKGRFPERAEEVAATTSFLKKSGLSVGDKLTMRNFDREYRIVGAYELPSALKTDQVNALPGALLGPLNKALEKADLPESHLNTTYLVAVKGGFTWNMVKEANAKGVLVESRQVAMDPPARSDVPYYKKSPYASYESSRGADAAALAAIATVVGLALLEICLLAGPAFAVGARRSRRQLGLVGANGGARNHIRAIVLAGGLVIGAAAAVVGTVAGTILAVLLQPVLEGQMGERFGSFDVRPLELLGIALLAVFTGTMAALVPAVTASRQSVLTSLTGRRGVRKTGRVLPVLGLIGVALGTAVALAGSLLFDSFAIVGLGAGVAELGVVALTPALVGLFGRLGRFLPLSPRLALRDAVRNRGRTAPAVAAVLAAVAGTVAVATYTASSDAQQRARYTPTMPSGVIAVVDEENPRDVPAIRDAAHRGFPVDVRADLSRIAVGKDRCTQYGGEDGCGRYEIVVPKANQCPLHATGPNDEDPASKFTVAERRKLAKDWRCDLGNGSFYGTDIVVADEKLLTVLGIKDEATVKALKEGRVVSFDKQNIDSAGKLAIRIITDSKAADKAYEAGKEPPGEIKSFAVHQAPESVNSYGITTVLPPSAASAAGLKAVPFGTYFSTDRLPTSKEEQGVDDALSKIGTDIALHIEKGYESEANIVLLALAVFAGLITIGAAGIATGLAQADAEADLKTLSAVGAPPRVRRTLSGFQCGVVSTMGVVLGSAAGVLPAIGLLLTERRDEMKWYQQALDSGYSPGPEPYIPLVLPWGTLGALIIAVPLGAALLAALLTRSRGALARREAS